MCNYPNVIEACIIEDLESEKIEEKKKQKQRSLKAYKLDRLSDIYSVDL